MRPLTALTLCAMTGLLVYVYATQDEQSDAAQTPSPAIASIESDTNDATAADTMADEQPVLVGLVIKVIDGDTIDVKLSSGPIRVRLYGIDTPERGQPWEDEATAHVRQRVLGKEVEIEPFEQDRYDRLVGIVFLDGVNINAELVARGDAWAYRRYMRKSDAELCADEAIARAAKRGLWSLPADERIAPWEWRRRKSLEYFTDYSDETAAQCVATIGSE